MTDMKKYNIRDYNINDGQAILDLFSLSFGKKLPMAAWNWRYPEGLEQPVVKLMFDGETLIGHYAVTPQPILMNNNESQVALSMNTMTHPGYLGKGIFTQLAQATYKSAADRGIFAVYGFPNKNSEKGFFGRLEWLRSEKLREWNLTTAKTANRPNRVRIVDPVFDESYDALWQKVKSRFSSVVPRSRAYLKWRITDCPSQFAKGNYKLFELRDNRELEGFLVFKLFLGEDKPKAHIMELMASDDSEVICDLIHAAGVYAKENDADSLSTWLYDSHPYRSDFVQMGFHESEKPIVWGGKIFNVNDTDQTRQLLKSWHISMLDSDVF